MTSPITATRANSKTPEEYAKAQEIPMEVLTEQLVRSLLRNAFAAGINEGLNIAMKKIEEYER